MNKQLTHYIAVTNCNGWGKHKKPREAIKTAIKQSAYQKKSDIEIKLFRVHESATVDDMGSLISPVTIHPEGIGTFDSQYRIK